MLYQMAYAISLVYVFAGIYLVHLVSAGGPGAIVEFREDYTFRMEDERVLEWRYVGEHFFVFERI